MGRRRPRKKTKALAKKFCHQNVKVYTSVVANPVVAVKAKVDCCGTTFYGVGGARCCRLDEFDEQRGLTIAAGRAATAIAMQLMEAGLTPWLDPQYTA